MGNTKIMKVYYNGIDKTENGSDAFRGVALGNFDGVHLGHRAIISTLTDKCREKGYSSMIYTFRNHPNNVLFEQKTLLIISTEAKEMIVKSLGVDELYFAEFDMEYAHMSPEMFAVKIIVEELNAKLVVVGYDYTFGCYGQGRAADLVEFGKKYGFEVIIVPAVKHVLSEADGRKTEITVSSTILRQLIKEGCVEQYKNLTNSYYTIPGRVVTGNHRGGKFGFPTANIIPSREFAIPKYGVYATQTRIGTKMYRSITNIGDNPTFGDVTQAVVETHLIDFHESIYGDEISVHFLEKMRNEIKFSSVDKLKEQIMKDINVRVEMEDELIEHNI